MPKSDFDIPDDLDDLARRAATAIVATIGGEPDGGGCRAFYSADEWRARGESYGRDAVLIVVHDGGAAAPFFNPYYEDTGAYARMMRALDKLGLWFEPCTSWYTAVYRS